MVTVAPFGLLRVAALPVDSLLALSPLWTTRCIMAALGALEEMEALRPALEDALHQVVPHLDRDQRRVALHLRRAVHNARTPSLPANEVAAIQHGLAEEDRQRLVMWLHHVQARDRHLAEADETYVPEAVHGQHRALRALARQEALARAIVVASPSLMAALDRTASAAETGSAPTRIDRSLLLFASRAAAKTSPFSVFMHHGLIRIAAAGPDSVHLDATSRISRTYLDRRQLFELHQLAHQSADPDAHCFRLNQSAAWRGDGRVDVLVPDFYTFTVRLLRLGRPTTFRLHPATAEHLMALPAPFSLAGLEEVLARAGLTAAAAKRLAHELRRRGLVEPVPYTSGYGEHPEVGCVAGICAAGGGRDDVRRAVTAVTRGAQAFERASAAERTVLLRVAASHLQHARALLGDAREPGSPPTVFREDGYFRDSVGTLGADTHALLMELAGQLRRRSRFTAPYVALRELFVAEYGVSGVCHDVRGFVTRASSELGASRAWFGDAGLAGEQVPLGTRVSAVAAVQFIESGDLDLPGKGRAIVLNEAYPGCGWLSARHACGESPFGDHLRDELSTWLERIHAPAEPIDIMLSGDCNSLQAHPRLTRRTLGWPIEPCDPAVPSLSLDATCLHHDPETGLLGMTNDAGSGLTPVYLGTTVPQPGWGPEFWLSTLCWPHRIARPAEELSPPHETPGDVLSLPRQTAGRVVMRRACWWVTSRRLARVWFRRDGARRLLDIAADCRQLGIPRYVFVRTARSVAVNAGTDHKPLWVDTGNPVCLEAMSPVLARTDWLLITEALPSRPTWPTLDGHGMTAELLVDVLL